MKPNVVMGLRGCVCSIQSSTERRHVLGRDRRTKLVLFSFSGMLLVVGDIVNRRKEKRETVIENEEREVK